jgi:hypothetical protein
MFGVGKSYRFQMRDIVRDDGEGLYEFNAEVVAVEGPLLTLRFDGKEETLNVDSILFVQAEEFDPAA